MTTRSAAAALALLLTPCFLFGPLGRARAEHCPTTVFCRPKCPCIKYKCVCPKPICPGCALENFGYYPTCWHPWPFPPNYSHCPCPPTTMTAPCSPTGVPANVGDQLPQPSPLPAPSEVK